MKPAKLIQKITKMMTIWTTSPTGCAKIQWNSAKIGSILITLTFTQSQNANIQRKLLLRLKQIKKWLASEFPFQILWKSCKSTPVPRMKKCWKSYLLRSKKIALPLNATSGWKPRHLLLLFNQVGLFLQYRNCRKTNQTLAKCSILFSIQWSTLTKNFSISSGTKAYRPSKTWWQTLKSLQKTQHFWELLGRRSTICQEGKIKHLLLKKLNSRNYNSGRRQD